MRSKRIEKLLRVVERPLVAVSGTVLVAMMFLKATDVICRYILNSPIPGALELNEFMMAITIPLAIAYCELERSHVSVEMIVERLSRSVRRPLHLIVTILSIFYLVMLSWQSILTIFDTYDSHQTSAVLLLPAYPFTIPLAAGFILFVVVMIINFITKEVPHGTN